MPSGSGAEGEVHGSGTNGTGECSGCYLNELFYSTKPKGQIFSIQVIHTSDTFVSISPLHFVNGDHFRSPRKLQK